MKTAKTEIERIEAEAGCELEELIDPTLADRARRLLACENPPQDRDAELCQAIAEGTRSDELRVLATMDGLYTQQSTKIVLYSDGSVMTCQMQDGVCGDYEVIGYHHIEGPRRGFQWV